MYFSTEQIMVIITTIIMVIIVKIIETFFHKKSFWLIITALLYFVCFYIKNQNFYPVLFELLSYVLILIFSLIIFYIFISRTLIFDYLRLIVGLIIILFILVHLFKSYNDLLKKQCDIDYGIYYEDTKFKNLFYKNSRDNCYKNGSLDWFRKSYKTYTN